MTMCSPSGSGSTIIPFGMKLAGQSPYLSINSSHLGLELQRAQLQEYTQRLQLGLRSFPGQMSSLNALAYHGHVSNPYMHPYFYKDPRARFIHEEPKPNHSYIGLIAMGILSSRDKKLVLSDIYQWILDNYSYFRTRGPGWRNSIRHNLSLNDCFIKSGRSANGKGHYWAVHPANVDDFEKGDFRRRRAQRRVRKHMGLSVPDDEDDDDSPAPSPVTAPQQPLHWEGDKLIDCTKDSGPDDSERIECHSPGSEKRSFNVSSQSDNTSSMSPAKRPKRLFDMDSILAPDDSVDKRCEAESAKEIDSANRDEHATYKTGSYSGSDSDNSDHKRHAMDLTLSRESVLDNDSDIKRSYIGSGINGNDLINKSSTGHPASSSSSFTGKTLPYIPQFTSGLHRGADLQQRVSAFRNASAYSWASLSGYLSNYQLMALSGQHPSVIQRSASMETESGWHRAVNNNISTQGMPPVREQSPLNQTVDE